MQEKHYYITRRLSSQTRLICFIIFKLKTPRYTSLMIRLSPAGTALEEKKCNFESQFEKCTYY